MSDSPKESHCHCSCHDPALSGFSCVHCKRVAISTESPINREELRQRLQKLGESFGYFWTFGQEPQLDRNAREQYLDHIETILVQEIDKAQLNCNQFGEDQPNTIHLCYFNKGVEACSRELDRGVEAAHLLEARHRATDALDRLIRLNRAETVKVLEEYIKNLAITPKGEEPQNESE